MAESDEAQGLEKMEAGEKNLKEKKVSWGKLRRVDSLSLEAGRIPWAPGHGSKDDWRTTFILAFQSIGVVYGDIGTSPLYVYSSTFPNGIGHKDDLLGVLSLIIYTIALVPLLKYVFIVLWANDNGDGGTFALYSLICRHIKVALIPKDQPEDKEISNYRLDTPSGNSRRAHKIKEILENSNVAKTILFLVTILGTSMVIGDGVLTPSISVLSAVSGIKSLGQDTVVGVSVAILIILFAVQRLGTDKVGSSFAPIVLLWLLFISGIGLYNLFKYDIRILRAFNPKYIIDYFRRNGTQGWVSLGGVVLCITGTEAMFADLGHFSVRAIQVSFSGLVFPGLLAAYIGQAAYLSKFPDDVGDTFYKSIPNPLYWPQFVVAVAAAIIASQAMISGAFSIVSQSLALNCFPRVKVVNTSAKYEGQVYIPEINYFLMIACVIVTVSFRTTTNIGNAYGIAVVAVMLITTCMLSLIMLTIWKTRVWLVALFFVVFFAIEGIYFSSVLYKFTQGGYLPLAFSLVLMIIMGVWHYVHKLKYVYELENKVSTEYIRDLVSDPNLKRVPGIGFLYSELVQGIPPIFPHFISNIPSIHSVLVFISIKPIPISRIAPEERFLLRQVETRQFRMFRCVVRYGYKDKIEEPEEFERQLVDHLKEFIRHEHFIHGGDHISAEEPAHIPHYGQLPNINDGKVKGASAVYVEESLQQPSPSCASSASIRSINAAIASNGMISAPIHVAEGEIQFVQRAMEKGVVYLMGETEVVAKPNSSLLKKMIVNYGYSFLRKNFRQGDKTLAIPKSKLLKVGMTCEI